MKLAWRTKNPESNLTSPTGQETIQVISSGSLARSVVRFDDGAICQHNRQFHDIVLHGPVSSCIGTTAIG